MLDKNSTAAAVQTPVGVWTGSVHHDDQAGSSSTISFAPDGTVALRTPVSVGTGLWSAEQPGRFSYEVTEIFIPAAGRSGSAKIQVEAHLEEDGYRGTGTAEVYSADGVPTHTTTSAEFTGDRLAERPATWHDVVSLGASIRGRLLLPGDDGFEEAVSGWLLTVQHRPAAVVVAADAADVAASRPPPSGSRRRPDARSRCSRPGTASRCPRTVPSSSPPGSCASCRWTRVPAPPGSAPDCGGARWSRQRPSTASRRCAAPPNWSG
jgi:hypothetical protein